MSEVSAGGAETADREAPAWSVREAEAADTAAAAQSYHGTRARSAPCRAGRCRKASARQAESIAAANCSS